MADALCHVPLLADLPLPMVPDDEAPDDQSARFLLSILDEIARPTPQPRRRASIPQLVQKLRQRAIDREYWKAMHTIREKLRHHRLGSGPPPRRPMDTHEIRALLARCLGRMQAPPPPSGTQQALGVCENALDVALTQYVDSAGSMVHPILPQNPSHLEPIAAVLYDALLCHLARADHRWALARLLLGLQQQWWWPCAPLGWRGGWVGQDGPSREAHRQRLSAPLTHWQRDALVAAIHEQCEMRGGAMPPAACAWSPEATFGKLMGHCRTVLVGMAYAQCVP